MKQHAMKLSVMLCLYLFSVWSVSAQLLDEDWEAGTTIDTGVWGAVGDNGTNHAARIIDDGNGNNAFLMGNSGLDWSVKLKSVQSFTRGNNLRVRFQTWGEPNPGDLTPPFNFVQVFPGASGLMGPWHNTAGTGGNIYADIEAGTDLWLSSMKHAENNTVQSGVDLSPEFQAAYAAATSRSEAIWIRVWLGDTMGAMFEWSDDDGATWNEEYDTRSAANFLLANNSSHPTGTASTVYVGFGPAQGGVYVDNILVWDDLTVPVELSDFAAE